MTILARCEKNGAVFPLSYVSRSDTKFSDWKRFSLQIAYYYSCSDLYSDKGFKIYNCARDLTFKRVSQDYIKLHFAYFCRQRFCFLCAWRRRKIWINRIWRGVVKIAEQIDFGAFFLTLSQKNCAMNELEAEFKRLSKAWKKLTTVASNSRYSLDFPNTYVRTFEVTKSINRLTGEVTFHPHIHALFIVPEDYFSYRYYIHQNSSSGRLGWVQRWQNALGVDYLPTAHVKGLLPEDVGRAVMQVLKYILKPSNFIDEQLEHFRPGITTEILDHLTTGTKKVRSVSLAGDLLDYCKNVPREEVEEDSEDYVRVSGGSPSMSEGKRGEMLRFVWTESPYVEGFQSYFLVES